MRPAGARRGDARGPGCAVLLCGRAAGRPCLAWLGLKWGAPLGACKAARLWAAPLGGGSACFVCIGTGRWVRRSQVAPQPQHRAGPGAPAGRAPQGARPLLRVFRDSERASPALGPARRPTHGVWWGGGRRVAVQSTERRDCREFAPAGARAAPRAGVWVSKSPPLHRGPRGADQGGPQGCSRGPGVGGKGLIHAPRRVGTREGAGRPPAAARRGAPAGPRGRVRGDRRCGGPLRRGG